jgi:ACS family hexuronate transporter-like MFS transporter
MSERAITPPLRPAVAWSLAIGATLTMAVSYFDRQTLSALGPSVREALMMSQEDWGWLGSAFSIAYLVGSPLAGRLVDRVGARRGLLGAVLVWTVVASMHAAVPSYAALFALRLALGLAEAPSFPGATQTVTRALPPEERARGFGILFTGSSLGALLAPILASWLAVRYGWRIAFLVTSVAGLAWIPMWLFVTRSPAARAALDAAPAARPTPSGGAAPDGIAGIVRVALHPAVMRASVVVFATAPMVAFVLTFSAIYLQTVEKVPQGDMGKYLWIPPVLFDAGSLLFGHFASRHATRHAGAPARGLFVVAGLLASTLGLLLVFPGPAPAMLVAGVALAGVGGLFAIFTADMLGRVPAPVVSTAGGLTAAAQSLAYIVAQPLIGRSVDVTGSYTTAILVLSAIVLPGVVVWLVWKPD